MCALFLSHRGVYVTVEADFIFFICSVSDSSVTDLCLKHNDYWAKHNYWAVITGDMTDILKCETTCIYKHICDGMGIKENYKYGAYAAMFSSLSFSFDDSAQSSEEHGRILNVSSESLFKHLWIITNSFKSA